ncbi:ArsR/SmtB family transcription factor [Desulfovibrio gilichinskyi]|uniref:Transcriptional regulator, ArsR family n=1 Tax=Desulfovibrio gilichinskyi TaxID=1519643 RepID=A0A1X7D1B9_9BACT|nr:metalloregulator ArsR/SmtB family transcription factor [Desulfovibrio gilichinskyi]SMF06931.1 transcriptional regulator, ArsR family [Desulfovibrio gilichinskyi]
MTDDTDSCSGHSPHPEDIAAVKSTMCSKRTMEEIAETFKILGEPVRITILHALSIRELCVCDLAEILDMSHSAVSHQLRILRAARMVRFEKQGRKALYRLDDSHVETIIQTALAHLTNEGCGQEIK